MGFGDRSDASGCLRERFAAGVSWFQGRSWVASIDLQQVAEDR